MKHYKFNVKSVKTESEVNLIKKYFFYEINKKRTFKGKPLVYAQSFISPEDCWLKFVAGGVQGNPSRKINPARVARVHWIFLILDIYYKNENPPSIYTNIREVPHSQDKFKLEISISDKNYFLYFKKIYRGNEIVKYVLLTAFPKK